MTEEELKCAMLVAYPGNWMMSGTRTEHDDYRSWSVVRKLDGTFWQVTSIDLAPRGSAMMKVETGDQIVDKKELAYFEDMYSHGWKNRRKKGARHDDKGVGDRSRLHSQRDAPTEDKGIE